MLVLMMGIMVVQVLMILLGVPVLVLVQLRDVQPESNSHQDGRYG